MASKAMHQTSHCLLALNSLKNVDSSPCPVSSVGKSIGRDIQRSLVQSQHGSKSFEFTLGYFLGGIANGSQWAKCQPGCNKDNI